MLKVGISLKIDIRDRLSHLVKKNTLSREEYLSMVPLHDVTALHFPTGRLQPERSAKKNCKCEERGYRGCPCGWLASGAPPGLRERQV